MSEELKPCPFCGRAPKAFCVTGTAVGSVVKCDHCQFDLLRVSEREAAIAWNERAAPVAPAIPPQGDAEPAWWKCVWCGSPSTAKARACSAPDGDGHLFESAADNQKGPR